MTYNIAIVGYGMAGVAAAIYARRSGHQVTHFERCHPPRSNGAGMLLHPPAQKQLEELGVLSDALSCGTKVNRITGQTTAGKRFLDFTYAENNTEKFGLGIQRGALHRILTDADQGKNKVITDTDIINVDAINGFLIDSKQIRHGPYDVIVIANGMHSLLRSDIQPSLKLPEINNSSALVGLLEDPDKMIADELSQYYQGNRHLSVWPAGSHTPEAIHKCSFAINVNPTEAITFAKNQRWQQHAINLYPEISPLLKQQTSTIVVHHYNYRHVEMRRLYNGRAVVIGDAAHSMSPQLGNGVQLGLEDAALLACALDTENDISDALRFYNINRSKQLRPYQKASRLLTPLFQSDSRLIRNVRHGVFSKLMKTGKMEKLARTLLG